MNLLRTILLLCLLGLSPGTHAQSIPVQDLAVLVDTTGTETIATASLPEAGKRYTPLDGALTAGYTRNVHWLRFTVQAPAAGEWWLEVQPPFLDDLRLFVPGPAGFVERRAGDHLPFSTREEDYRGFVFKLALPDTQPRTFYLRLQTTSSSIASLKLWHPERFHAAKNAEYAVLGIYIGFILLVLVLNLGLWASLREALYGWFAVHIFASGMLSVSGMGLVFQFLLRDSPRLADKLTGAALLLALPAAIPFARRMLRVERDQVWLFTLFRLQVALPCVLLLSLAVGFYTEAARITLSFMLILALVGFVLSYRLWRQGLHEGIYMLLGNLFALSGGAVSALAMLGFNPGDLLSIYARQVTGLGNILAMQFALAVRIRVMHARQRQSLEQIQAAELDAAREREAHREQGRFIGMLSHELKTPLAVIDGAARSLTRLDHSGNPEVTRRHERIRRGVGRIDRLVEQFLTTDRIDEEGMTLRRGAVNVLTLLNQVADTSPDGAERLHLKAPATLSLVADGALLRVAVANLADNALKYAPPESQVHLSGMLQNVNGLAGVEILVSDDGPGIPPELHEQVFSRYIRGDNVGRISGAGLGLYLVRRIAELHGGQAALMPGPGGAVFRLWLPDGRESIA